MSHPAETDLSYSDAFVLLDSACRVLTQLHKVDAANEIQELSDKLTKRAGRGNRNPAPASDEELVHLGKEICEAVARTLDARRDVKSAIKGTHEGDNLYTIDHRCNIAANTIIKNWNRIKQTNIILVGEDIDTPGIHPSDHSIIICLDALDGTEHWRRGRNLYCTALSIFRRSDNRSTHSLRCSVVMDADHRTFWASEENACAFWKRKGEIEEPLVSLFDATSELANAHVCTVARRSSQYATLVSCLSQGPFPFWGLYTFGGNPIVAALPLGEYDAAFQLPRGIPGDLTKIWDWLPGLHIARRAGCHVVPLRPGFDLIDHAEQVVSGMAMLEDVSFAVSASERLAHELIEWMAARMPA